MERFGSTSHRGFSVRSIFTFVLVVVVTALLWAIFGSTTPTHAADASWSGDAIIYDTRQYNKVDPATLDKSHGIADGSTIYIYRDAASGAASSRNAFILYFAPGVDPPTATSAEFVTFNYSTSGVFSNARDKTTVSLTLKGEEEPLSSCSVSGVGWMICPISVFLAESMDGLFDILSMLIAVQPAILGDPNNDLYKAWNIMRNIANIAFVIAFLIIIYSQLTSVGLSNYGLKKMIPRLIIAALLVNLSFIITALAIDISNILGYSLQDVFTSIREEIFAVTNDTWGGTVNWATVTGLILGGGALGFAAVGSAGGVIPILVALLVGLALTLIFVVIILAARQAIIIILVIIAPLAFVAYLLPNTEKLFDKWRGLFMTMLIFFPAFSLVFGGSQLAGQIILQNAGDNVIMVLFGLAVQIAPLVITPLILKLSGSLLGRIAQIVNNPQKGFMDRVNNWKDADIERRRQTNLGKEGTRNPFIRGLQAIDNAGRKTKGQTELAKLRSDNRYHKTKAYEKLHEDTDVATMQKERIDNQHKKHSHTLMNTRGTKLHYEMVELETSKTAVENVTQQTDTIRAEYRAGGYDTGGDARLTRLQNTMARNVIEKTAYVSAASHAAGMQQLKYAREIKSTNVFANGQTLQQIAGGIDQNGSQRALASALALLDKSRKETLDNIKVIISDTNATTQEIRLLAEGTSVRGIQVTHDARAAALQMTLGGGDTRQVVAALQSLDLSFPGATADEREELQVIAAEALEGNGTRPPFVTAGATAMMKQGNDFSNTPFTGSYGQSGLQGMIIRAINDQKLDSGKLQTAGKDYTSAILDAVKNAPVGAISREALDRLKKELTTTLDRSRAASEKLGDSRPILEDIEKLL